MAKAKKFNIETFVEDAAEGVQVAQQQRQKEEEEQKRKEEEALRLKEEEARKLKEEEEQAKAEELYAQQLAAQQMANLQITPQQLAAQQLAAQQAAQMMQMQANMSPAYMQVPNPMLMGGVGETTTSYKEEDTQKSKRGRRKSLRTIERVNGKIVYLEKEMDADLAKLSTFERFDKQDIIRTALFQWMNLHFDGMMLDDAGRREVIEYIQRTTTFE